MFWRADFAGRALNLDRWGSDLPVLVGANTTPPNNILSPMLILYPRKWQDAYLTEYAENFLTHFVMAVDGWDFASNGFDMTIAKAIDWARYLRSWGLFVALWRTAPITGDPFAAAMRDAGVLDWLIPGEEVDTKVTAEQYDAVLRDSLQYGVPLGAHFTDNYPEGFPRDTFVTHWADFNGRVHCMWQANQNESAGTQAARMYYARQRVNLGLVGGDGRPAPDSLVYAYEVQSSAQFDPHAWTIPRPDAANSYGTCTEAYGTLRGKELLFATRDDVRIRPVGGVGNGGTRAQDGTPF